MNELPQQVNEWLAANGQGGLLSIESLGGGCINQARILHTEAGNSFFLKSHPAPPQDIFIREAESLQALSVPDGPVVPEVILAGRDFLLLEDLQPALRRQDFWEVYGQQLASLHLRTNRQFGFPHDNYLGISPQANSWMESGIDFFRDRRLAPQIRWAKQRGLLDSSDLQQCDSLLRRLPDLLPGGPACLLHGDLWSGNLISDAAGNPALIDPAAYYGWAEADLAMTDLFGRYPDSFYGSYLEINPLLPGFRERYPLYNLYHLLNHLNLFGREYLQGIKGVLKRFS